MAIGGKLAQRGLAEDHRAGGAQAPDDLGVGGCRRRAAAGAVRGDLAGEVDVVLDRDRDPEQRPPLSVSGAASVAASASASARSARTEMNARSVGFSRSIRAR